MTAHEAKTDNLNGRRQVQVIVRKHHSHEHYIAVSPDVEGFIAQGATLEKLYTRIPLVLNRLMELRGEVFRVGNKIVEQDDVPSSLQTLMLPLEAV